MNFNKYTDEEISDFLTEFKDKIQEDLFEIKKRKKNNDTVRLYRLNRRKIRNMLLEIEIKDFVHKRIDESHYDLGNGLLVVFKRTYRLTNMFGDEADVIVYIKYKEVGENDIIPVISFHEDD